MKKILITGVNSYIGNQFSSWVNHQGYNYHIQKISVKDNEWKKMNWAKIDVVLHVAGIAHNSNDPSLESLYYEVNRDLTTEIALKAKDEGVPHFINMSSIIIFGTTTSKIDDKTIPQPDNFYGQSKLQAENNLKQLIDDSFIVANIRPPMVYGKNSKGNFPLLQKLSLRTPIFPDYENQRSMIYIKNLTEFLRIVIDNKMGGNLHPQNKDYVKTTELVKIIGKNQNHSIYVTRAFNPLIKLFSNNKLIQKVFGNLFYSKEMFDGNVEYQLYSLRNSIEDIYNI